MVQKSTKMDFTCWRNSDWPKLPIFQMARKVTAGEAALYDPILGHELPVLFKHSANHGLWCARANFPAARHTLDFGGNPGVCA